jgi:hypothetical protein
VTVQEVVIRVKKFVPIRVAEQEYVPSPKKQKTEIAYSDKDVAVKFWLNEEGKNG